MTGAENSPVAVAEPGLGYIDQGALVWVVEIPVA